jgi:hypothetical protein
MTETSVVRDLVVRETGSELGNLEGADGPWFGRLRATAADLEEITTITFDRVAQPQPASDFEIAKISAWCRKHNYTCRTSRRGELKLRPKSSAAATHARPAM